MLSAAAKAARDRTAPIGRDEAHMIKRYVLSDAEMVKVRGLVK